MPVHRRQWILNLAPAVLLAVGGAPLLAQDPTSLMTPAVARAGKRLACLCGTCRNSVADCPMPHCSYCEPMRARIKDMEARGMTDVAIVNTIVREQGIVALAAPPAEGWGLLTWVMPSIVLLLGFVVYWWYVRRNRQAPQPVNDVDRAVLDRFRDQIEGELGDQGDDPLPGSGNKPK